MAQVVARAGDPAAVVVGASMASTEPRGEQILRLAPATSLIGAAPAVVCEALLQYAEHHEGVLLWNGSAGQVSPGRWAAGIDLDDQVVVYRLTQGPLPHMVLRFATEPTDDDHTHLIATTEYALSGTRMAGVWERWKARRTATSLRDGMLVGLRQVLPVAHGSERRNAARVAMHTLAQLRIGDQVWHGEVQDVSATGLGLIVATQPEEIEDAAMVLCAHGSGEVELMLPQARARARVLITRAVPHRKGLEVGLWMSDSAEASALAEKVLPYINQDLRADSPEEC